MSRSSVAILFLCVHCAHAPYLEPLTATQTSGSATGSFTQFIAVGSENRSIRGTLEVGAPSSSLTPQNNPPTGGSTISRSAASPDGTNIFVAAENDTATDRANLLYSDNQGVTFRYLTLTSLTGMDLAVNAPLRNIEFLRSSQTFFGLLVGDGDATASAVYSISGSAAAPVFARRVTTGCIAGIANFYGAKIVSTSHLFVGQSINRVACHSIDQGVTWTNDDLSTPGTGAVRDFAFVEPSDLWAVGGSTSTPSNFIYKKNNLTSDGPTSWTKQCDSDPAASGGAAGGCIGNGVGVLSSISFISSTQGWAVGELGLYYKTTNGGATWTRVNVTRNGAVFAQNFTRIAMRSSGYGILLAESSGVVFLTKDFGESWTDAGTTTFSMRGLYVK